MSTPDLPRPQAAGPGRDNRSWDDAGRSRARAEGYGPAGGYDRYDGRDRGGHRDGRPAAGRGHRAAASGSREADGYPARGGGRRAAGGRDGYPARGSGRGDSRAWQRPGSGRGGRDAGGQTWQSREPGLPDESGEWYRGTTVRDRYPARPGPARRYPGGGRRPGGRGPGGPGGRGGGPGRPGGRLRLGGNWWRQWTWRKALTLAGIGAGVFTVVGAATVGVAYAATTIPNPESSALEQASSVYFSDGTTLIGRFGTVNRVDLNINQIPAVVQHAVVAAEDKNFYHEGGISPTGILRAAYYDLTSAGGSLQGGSTITQQLVRNYYDSIGTQQTVSRKVKEIFVAQKLAQVKSKQWILQQYLNTVYFGGGAYGIGAAAQYYFGIQPTDLKKITPAQAAMIAAMIQSPSYYSPNPKAGAAYKGLVFRWQYVLRTMNAMGNLPQPQYAAALRKFPRVIKPVNNSWSGYTGYLMMAVYRELKGTYNLSDNRINNGGLRIVTTFRRNLQNGLQASVTHMRTLMRDCTPPSTAVTGGGNAVANGYPCTPYSQWRKWMNVGAVLEQPGTGAILAMYGGPNYSTQQYDDALVARNQVGSSFKPYVLATAVSEGMNVQTSLLNGFSPLYIPPITEPLVTASRTPKTTGGYFGPITNDEAVASQGPVHVNVATAESLNTAFTDLYHRVAEPTGSGPDKVVAMAKAFGVNVGSYPNGSGLADKSGQVGIALGTASLTVGEQANTIATLADGGTYYTPHVVSRIIAGSATTQAKVETRQVLTPQQAADVDWAMSFDTQPGLGTAPGQGMDNGQPIIGKTGTTDLAQQAFFMGATPRYAMAVGMFVNVTKCPKIYTQACASKSSLTYAPPLGHGMQTLFGIGGLAGYGGGWPAGIWHDFFNKEFSSLPLQQWPLVNTAGMSTWNLVGKLPPKPKPHPTPGAQASCPPFSFKRHCKQGQGGTPTPNPTGPGCLPGLPTCPSPQPSPTSGGGGGGRPKPTSSP